MNLLIYFLFNCRNASFKEDDGTWKGNDDGKVVNNQPQRVMDDRNGMIAQAGYIGRYVRTIKLDCFFFVVGNHIKLIYWGYFRITNDAREDEMEDNMGQVNTMIGNLRNMALDMGSELENQNKQIDRINRKVMYNDLKGLSAQIVLGCHIVIKFINLF